MNLKLQRNKDEYYKIRFRVAKNLQPFFNKEFISKSLSTKDYNQAYKKASDIYKKYNNIKEVIVMLPKETIQELVNKFITDTLEQDLVDRAVRGNGIVSSNENREIEDIETMAKSNITATTNIIDEQKEMIANADYSMMDTVAEKLTKKLDGIDKESEEYKLFLYYLNLAHVKVLEESNSRNSGNVPTEPIEVTREIFKDFGKQEEIKPTSPTPTALVEETDKGELLVDVYRAFVKDYLVPNGIKEKPLTDTTNMFSKVFIPFVKYSLNKEDVCIKEVTRDIINEFNYYCQNKPKGTYKIYQNLTIQEIIELDDVPDEHIIAPKTRREYLVMIQKFFKYLEKIKVIDVDPTNTLKLPPKKGNNIRKIFTADDKERIFKWTDSLGSRTLVYYTLAYTGMRLSEFYKAKIGFDTEHSIYYFDLMYDGVELKTESSKRKIPLHKKLIDLDIQNKLKELQEANHIDTISQKFNRKLPELIEDSDSKVLYSFRHTVVTDLLNKKVEPLVVSKLLGHSFSGDNMTTTQYFKGFSLDILKEAIDNLE